MSPLNVLPSEYTPKALRMPKNDRTQRPRAYAVMVEPRNDPFGAGGVLGPAPVIDPCLEYVPTKAEIDAGRVTIYQVDGPDPTDFPMYEWVVERGCWRRTSETTGSRGV